MKIIKHDNGMVFVGKVWEIRYILKKYQKKYTYLHEWIQDTKKIRKE